MSILGVIVRALPAHLDDIDLQLRTLPGVDVAARDEGRLVLVIEDTSSTAAAATLAGIALWPQVLNTSLVYEYSGPDAPAPEAGVGAYSDWRTSLASLAGQHQP